MGIIGLLNDDRVLELNDFLIDMISLREMEIMSSSK